MGELVWDAIGERTFEGGISKGVIYFEDGRSVVWNGLTSVNESTDRSTSAVYYDGAKVSEIVSAGDFTGTISAYTYPDEVLEIEGFARLGSGVHLGEQIGEKFNLSYQTKIGDDILGIDAGYKIHILYNVTAIPNDKTYETISNAVGVEAFEWSFTTVPEEVAGFRPSARVVIDSRTVLSDTLDKIELMLYGRGVTRPKFPTFTELMGLLVNDYIIDITDLKDGRWTATAKQDGYIGVEDDGSFQIDNVEATYIDPETYTVSDTLS